MGGGEDIWGGKIFGKANRAEGPREQSGGEGGAREVVVESGVAPDTEDPLEDAPEAAVDEVIRASAAGADEEEEDEEDVLEAD